MPDVGLPTGQRPRDPSCLFTWDDPDVPEGFHRCVLAEWHATDHECECGEIYERRSRLKVPPGEQR
jgi:hypothetical protein